MHVFDALDLRRLYLEHNPSLVCIPIQARAFAALSVYRGPETRCLLCAPQNAQDSPGCKCAGGYTVTAIEALHSNAMRMNPESYTLETLKSAMQGHDGFISSQETCCVLLRDPTEAHALRALRAHTR